MSPKPEYISPSKFESFRRCPRRFKEEKFTDSPATRFGTCVHAGLAAYFRAMDPNHFQPAFVSEANKEGVPDSYLPRALECFRAVRESEKLNISLDNIITLESEDGEVSYNFSSGKKTFFQVDIVPGVWGIRGGMDLVDTIENGEYIRIIDWKTGLTEQEDDLQLTCYALAAWKKYGATKIEVAFFGLEKGGAYRSTRWDEETLKSAATYIHALATEYIDSHKKNEFPERTNQYCNYCSLKEKCQSYQKQIENPPVQKMYEIEAKLENLPVLLEAYERILSIKKAAEAIEKDLNEKRKSILVEHGPQNVGGRTIRAINYTSSYDYNVESIFMGAKDLVGRYPFEVLKFDSGGFEALQKEFPEKKKALDKLLKANRTPAGKAVKVTTAISKDNEE